MNLKDFQQHVDARFDRVENKIDDHLARLSKAEEAIVWIRGHLRISTGVFLSVVTALILYYLNLKP